MPMRDAASTSTLARDPSKRSKLATLKNLPAAPSASGIPPVRPGGSARSGSSEAPSSAHRQAEASASASIVPSSCADRGAELARLLCAIGADLHSVAADVALVFLRRALEAAPREGSLAAEVMGAICVALNSLGRHADALEMADGACEALRKGGGPPSVQLAATLHNKSCCHEYLGERSAALQAAERGLSVASKLGLPADDALLVITSTAFRTSR